MNPRLPALSAVLLLACLACFGQGAQRILVDSSHTGAVNEILFDGRRGLLVSGGEDGTVRLWEAGTGRLKACLRVSHRPVQRLAVHPGRPQVAVLIGENLKTDTLSVWDWEQGRELFQLSSARQLLYLDYAPMGGYLVYSKADFRSLQAVDPQDGRPLDLFNGGFGIVSFFVISKNENTVMGYQPSGWITYWDVRRQEAVLRARTLADLSLIRVTPSGRHMLGVDGERLAAVDLLNGGLAAEQQITGAGRLAVSGDGREVAALVSEGTGWQVRRWTFGGTSFRAVGASEAPPGSAPLASLVYGAESLYAADKAGSIHARSRDGRWEIFARDLHLPISGLAFHGDTMAAASSAGIFLYTSGFFGSQSSEADWEVRRKVLSNPYTGPIGVEFLDERRILVWPKDQETGALVVMEASGGPARELPVAFSAPIQQASVSSRGLIVVERGGACRILDPEDYQVRFRCVVPSMNKLVGTRGDFFVGAASAASVFGSPLIQINIRSGETVPIPESSRFIYELLYSRSSGSLYCLAVEQREGRWSTLLLGRSGRLFERRLLLDSFDGEDLGASLAEDDSGRLYCSLGYAGVASWDGSRLAMLPRDPGRVARRLTAHGHRLYALNSDSTLSVWDPSAAVRPWELHLFYDGSWAAVSPEQSVYCSEEARRLLTQS